MAHKKLTIDEVIQALIDAHGLKTYAADALHVDYKTLMRYVDSSPKAQEIIKAMQHKRSDVAKSKLDEALMRGESWAILYSLKNKPDPDGEFVGEKNLLDITTNGERINKVIIEYSEVETAETAQSATDDKDRAQEI